jgi:hypothetical protein
VRACVCACVRVCVQGLVCVCRWACVRAHARLYACVFTNVHVSVDDDMRVDRCVYGWRRGCVYMD